MASPGNQPSTPLHVVAIPYPGRGHINPMLNLCRVVAARRRSDLVITFVLTEEWLGLIGSAAKPPNISFASIPNIVPSELVRGDDPQGFTIAVKSKMGQPFEDLLSAGTHAPPNLIVSDALLPWAGEAAARRNIPVAYFWCMSASMFAFFYHFDLLAQHDHYPFDSSVDENAIVDYIPGLPPIRLSDLPPIIKDPELPSKFLKSLPSESKTEYLIFNTISDLESQVLLHLKQRTTFSIFNIGPADSYFTSKKNFTNSTSTDEGYSKWLDLQPIGSVLYVSLGSFLQISRAQMDEIALGLKGSGVRFLWVARRETGRLQGNGLVVEWCDQLKVLCHPSVGGFWSHCGWNSTKESALAGVPMLTWPILVDQFLNAKAIVEDWGVGWRVKGRDFVVKGDEIKDVVGRFMDPGNEERGELERNAIKLKEICGREFEDGGSFDMNLDGFVESIMQRTNRQMFS